MPGAEGREQARRILQDAEQVLRAFERACRLNVAAGVVMEWCGLGAAESLALIGFVANRTSRAPLDVANELIRSHGNDPDLTV
jgi:hypothetical protein